MPKNIFSIYWGEIIKEAFQLKSVTYFEFQVFHTTINNIYNPNFYNCKQDPHIFNVAIVADFR